MYSHRDSGKTRLVITGGGTGGHVFPGIAVAEALSGMTPLEVLWIGTGRKVEVDALSVTEWEHAVLDVMPIKGTGLAHRIKAVLTLPAAVVRAAAWLKRFRPHVVLGVGGYVSGPVLMASKMAGIPSAIHEQNAVPGLANRMAARFASRIFITYRESAAFFGDAETELTGNPVRGSILSSGSRSYPVAPGGRRPSLLILGGSQGAAALNRVACAAVRSLWQSGKKIHIVHQTGAAAEEETAQYYKREGIDASVRAFITDMAAAYREADLVISRAGATTLAELTALGKPSILIPYPYAADNHQEKNARAMTDAGAAVMFREADIGAVRLAGEIEDIVTDSKRLASMSQAAWKLGKRDAASRIARELMKLAGRPVASGAMNDQESGELMNDRTFAAEVRGVSAFQSVRW